MLKKIRTGIKERYMSLREDSFSKGHVRGVKYRWYISYFLVLIFPIFIFFVCSVNFQMTLNKKTNQQSQTEIERIMQKIDGEVRLFNIMATYFEDNKDVKALASVGMEIDEQDKALIDAAAKQLNKYKSLYGYDGSVYLYLNESDMIITENGMVQPYTYFVQNYVQTDISYSEWKNSISMLLESSYKVISLFQNTNNGAFLQDSMQIRTIMQNEEAICQVVAYKKDSIFKVNSIEEPIDFEYAILDEYGKVTYASNSLRRFVNHSIDDKIQIHNNTYIVNRKKSAWSEYTYIVACQTENLMLYFLPMLVLSLVLLFVSSLLLRYTINKNYSPLEKVFMKVKRFSVANGVEDEYRFVDTILDNLETDMKAMNSEVLQQRKQLKEMYLKTIMTGQRREIQSVKDKMEQYTDIKFLSDCFAVVVIFIKDYKELFKGDLKSNDREQKDLVHNVIKNVAEEFVSKQQNVGYVVNIYDTPILLISFSEENIPAASEQTQKLVGEFEGVMFEQFKIDLTAVAGKICRGIYNVAASYNEAISLNGDRDMNELANMDDYLLSNETIQQIKGAIENGNAMFAKNIAEEIFYRASELYKNDLVFLKMIFTDLLHVIIETGQECGRSVNKTKILSAVSRAERTDDILQQIRDMIDSICLVSQTNKNKLTIYEIKKFVEKNLSNPELSVYYTAQMLETSEKVLSKIVKTEYNVGLLEYINRCRIQKAKIYLETTEQTIVEISKAVGYLNVKTFIRVFKQYSNTTPTQYRRMKGK